MSVMACAPAGRKPLPHRRDVVIEPVRVGTRSLWERTISAGFEGLDEVDDDHAGSGQDHSNHPGGLLLSGAMFLRRTARRRSDDPPWTSRHLLRR